jgi:signal transduction histidine kinase
VDYHHVIEAAGIVLLALIAYSYARRWLVAAASADRRWHPAVYGCIAGVAAVALMDARIYVGDGDFIDARAVPIALIGLAEGGWAALLAALLAILYRAWLGGSGAVAGVLGLLGVAVAATLAHRWASRNGGVRIKHSLTLAAVTFVVTFGSFATLGISGLKRFEPVWPEFLAVLVIGIVSLARLFADVAGAQRTEAAREEAAQMRAVTLLARAAAHEINNPLMIVYGALGFVARVVSEGTKEAEWVGRARENSDRIRDIVVKMNQITQIVATEQRGALPPMLDIRKSSGEEPEPPEPR